MAEIAVGDLVVRKSHGGDIVFKVTDIFSTAVGEERAMLKGLHMRLMADAPLGDLERVTAEHLKRDLLRLEASTNETIRRIMNRRSLDYESLHLSRGENNKKYNFFNVPGRVLHIDGDEEYLHMCLKTYNQLHLEALGKWADEEKQPQVVVELVREYHPDILVLTGHDALVGGGKKDLRDINNYRNSRFFVQAVKNVRLMAPDRDDIVIFAGACQSYFEAILAAGANFASSPTRIMIHAYDPVFIAEKVAFTPISKTVDINEAIHASVTGIEGVGGLETRGKFRLGLPKTPYG